MDDCLSRHSCNTGDGEPKICGEADPYFDVMIAVGATAPDGTFTVEIDWGDGRPTSTCPGGPHEFCWDDGQYTWCGTRVYASCGSGALLVYGTHVELWIGGLQPDSCVDLYVGEIVP